MAAQQAAIGVMTWLLVWAVNQFGILYLFALINGCEELTGDVAVRLVSVLRYVRKCGEVQQAVIFAGVVLTQGEGGVCPVDGHSVRGNFP